MEVARLSETEKSARNRRRRSPVDAFAWPMGGQVKKRRLTTSIANAAKATIFEFTRRSRIQRLWAKANDFYLGIDSNDEDDSWRSSPRQVSPVNDDSEHYQASNYQNIRKVASILAPSPADVFYDIGCGKGR